MGAKQSRETTTSSEREFVFTRTFDAPRSLVFNAWTDPKHVTQWWGPRGFTTTIHEMEVKPGSGWRHTMHGPDGTDYPNRSVFVEVAKPERIVYSHGGGKQGGPGAQFQATWTFEAQGNNTKLTLRMVFPSAEARDQVVKEYGAIEGGNQTLDRLDAMVRAERLHDAHRHAGFSPGRRLSRLLALFTIRTLGAIEIGRGSGAEVITERFATHSTSGGLMRDVDGYVLPVPKKQLQAYRRLAQKASRLWREHGALEYRECAGDDLDVKMGMSFPKQMSLKSGETVVFAWIVFKSRAHRDSVNAKVMKDPRIANMCDPKSMPFDVKRMCYGGFQVLVDA